jgi:hypothetical protein
MYAFLPTVECRRMRREPSRHLYATLELCGEHKEDRFKNDRDLR